MQIGLNSNINNNSFGALRIKCKSNTIKNIIKDDKSLNQLSQVVENKFGKNLLVSVSHRKAHNFYKTDIYKPILSEDKGFVGNFLTKIGFGEKIQLSHYHSINGIYTRCDKEGILKSKKLTISAVISILGLNK